MPGAQHQAERSSGPLLPMRAASTLPAASPGNRREGQGEDKDWSKLEEKLLLVRSCMTMQLEGGGSHPWNQNQHPYKTTARIKVVRSAWWTFISPAPLQAEDLTDSQTRHVPTPFAVVPGEQPSFHGHGQAIQDQQENGQGTMFSNVPRKVSTLQRSSSKDRILHMFKWLENFTTKITSLVFYI